MVTSSRTLSTKAVCTATQITFMFMQRVYSIFMYLFTQAPYCLTYLCHPTCLRSPLKIDPPGSSGNISITYLLYSNSSSLDLYCECCLPANKILYETSTRLMLVLIFSTHAQLREGGLARGWIEPGCQFLDGFQQ